MSVRARVVVLALVLLVAVTALIGRLAQVQLSGHDDFSAARADVPTRTIAVPALRGRILAADGTVLAEDTARVALTVDPAALADAADRGDALFTALGARLGVDAARVRARTLACGSPGADPIPVCWSGSPQAAIPVAVDVDPQVALSIVERPDLFPGVTAVPVAVRSYPASSTAMMAHLLGYLGPVTAAELAADGTLVQSDLVGRAGLERQYDAQLRGIPGSRTVTIDPRGVPTGVVAEQDPVPGRDLRTHLQVPIQRAAEQGLSRAVARARRDGEPATAGAAVVLELRTGGVVAAASWPSYDPQTWSGGIGADDYAALTDPAGGRPLLDRVTTYAAPPGSTFKPVSALAALRSGAGLDRRYDCPSSYTLGGLTFRNFESRALGSISLHTALEYSCNTVFYALAADAWRSAGGLAGSDEHDPFVTTAAALGIGTRTGIDLPDETPGVLPSRAWRTEQWQANRDQWCAAAEKGYPDESDPERRRYLVDIAQENCTDGATLRAGDELNLSIGQGALAVSPLQMAQAYAQILSPEGAWQPRVGQALLDPGDGTVEPIATRRAPAPAIPARQRAYLTSALEAVVTSGSARATFDGFDLADWPVAAKTGTAEAAGRTASSWFLSFAPAERPRYVVAAVVVEGGLGGGAAGSVSRTIHEALAALPR